MEKHSTNPTPTTPAEIPPLLVIPSADFGGPFLSVFDPQGWDEIKVDMPISLDKEGRPEEVIDAVTAISVVARQLERLAGRDACARLWPNEPYSQPFTAERWVALLDQALADLNQARERIAREISPG